MSYLISGTTTGLAIRRMSASNHPATDIEASQDLGILVDVSACTGCKACEVACISWHDLTPPIATEQDLRQAGFSFQSAPDLAPNLFMLMRYQEAETERGWTWFMTKRQCMHCYDPGCLKACPSPGAIVQYANGVVDFDHSKCIGCGLCRSGCPFDIPRYDANRHPCKCNFCLDRVGNGGVPACVKTCPTNALHFGSRSDMKERGQQKEQHPEVGAILDFYGRVLQRQLATADEAGIGAGSVTEIPWRAHVGLLRSFIDLCTEAPAAELAQGADRLRGVDDSRLTALVESFLRDQEAAPVERFILTGFLGGALVVPASLAPYDRREWLKNVCPVCGFPPVVSYLADLDEIEGGRFARCGVCHADWYFGRATCLACGNTNDKELHYYVPEGVGCPHPSSFRPARPAAATSSRWTPGASRKGPRSSTTSRR